MEERVKVGKGERENGQETKENRERDNGKRSKMEQGEKPKIVKNGKGKKGERSGGRGALVLS